VDSPENGEVAMTQANPPSTPHPLSMYESVGELRRLVERSTCCTIDITSLLGEPLM
jgi:hypothetical protein